MSLEKLGIAIEDKIEKGVATMCNLSDLVEEKGIRKGERRGIRKGEREGARKMQRSIAFGLLRQGYKSEEVAKMPEIELTKLEKLIK